MISINTFGGCGIQHPGSLWCWGRNAEGQLGTGDHEDQDLPMHIGEDVDWIWVSSGRFHTCGLTRDRWAWCAGENADGQLGTGDLNRRSRFTAIPAPAP